MKAPLLAIMVLAATLTGCSDAAKARAEAEKARAEAEIVKAGSARVQADFEATKLQAAAEKAKADLARAQLELALAKLKADIETVKPAPPPLVDAPAEPAILRSEPVTRGRLLATVGATGTLQAQDAVDVSAQVQGKIVSIGEDKNRRSGLIDWGSEVEGPVKDKDGKIVRQGTILAQIDPTLYATSAQRGQGENVVRQGVRPFRPG